MDPLQSVQNDLSNVQKAHKQIAEEIDLLKVALPFLTGDNIVSNVRKVMDLLEKDILPHFDYEEHQLFPPVSVK
ncbi:MAG: hypothetical protein QME51_02735 [Planctomycetota bacterium]|nr:hypothetical protein [Planctomycetota bacterium]MDI6787270.1 hypothetical protein [Planctomycetota bacterium]